MSIVTCTAKTRNDLSVARIVIEVLAQSWGYKCSVTYNEGKSFDIMVPVGAEENAILKFKRLAPDLDIYKSDKKAMATAKTESRRHIKREFHDPYGDAPSIEQWTALGELSYENCPNDLQRYIIEWGSDADMSREEVISAWNNDDNGIRNDVLNDAASDELFTATELRSILGESRKLRRKSESRRCMKKEGSETEEEFIQKYRNKSFVELPYNLRMYMKEGGFTINDWDIPEDPQFRSSMLGDAWTDGIRD